MSNGISGIRITSAPPAIPECSAIQPALRPITSTTRMRLWLSAVVCRRAIASGAPPRVQTVRRTERVLAADCDQAVELIARQRRLDPLDAVLALVDVRPRAAE